MNTAGLTVLAKFIFFIFMFPLLHIVVEIVEKNVFIVGLLLQQVTAEQCSVALVFTK